MTYRAMCGSKVLFLIKKPAGIEELFQRKPAFLIPLPEFCFGWVLLLDVAGHIWNSFRVKLFLGFLASGAFGVAKKDHGGSPPVVGYLRVSPLEVLYAIAAWKTMGFAAILRLSTSLPYQNRFANPVGNQLPVTGGVVFQQWLHHLRKLFPGKRGDFQLFSVQIFQRKGKGCFYVAVFQQLGGKDLCQCLVAELIQLVPDAAVQPFFLVTLGGGFCNFLIGYQVYSHFISSTVSPIASSAIRPCVFRIISGGS